MGPEGCLLGPVTRKSTLGRGKSSANTFLGRCFLGCWRVEARVAEGEWNVRSEKKGASSDVSFYESELRCMGECRGDTGQDPTGCFVENCVCRGGEGGAGRPRRSLLQ